jgi:hypothetical protein
LPFPDRERRHNQQSTSVKIRGFCKRYLRAAQAYMLISMPTGTSTIPGVFQAISALLLKGDGRLPYQDKGKVALKVSQAHIPRAAGMNDGEILRAAWFVPRQ